MHVTDQKFKTASEQPMQSAAGDPLPRTRLRVRSRYSSQTVAEFEHLIPREAVRAALAPGTCDQPAPEIVWDGTDDVAALDIDTHDATRRPAEEKFDLAVAILARETGGDVHWRTHRGGARII